MLTLLNSKSPTLFRSGVQRGAPQGVDREGGDDGFGVILGASIIARGEALGHGMWVDQEMLKQTADKINAAVQLGVKARFAHPDMSGDGIGTGLGRVKNARLHENNVTADLHFSLASTRTPDGDLADYVMSLAEGEPDHFGFSIAFNRDFNAEEEFVEANKREVEATNRSGEKERRRVFQSPDTKNEKNLPHARMSKLRAADAVDSPAANPKGLFYSEKNDLLGAAETGLSYLFGLTDEAPDGQTFGVDPDRARAFFTRFLDSHNLSVVDTKLEREQPKSNSSPESIMTDEQFSALEKNFAELKTALANKPDSPGEDQPKGEPLLSKPSREEALSALGLTEEQFKDAQDAKAKADKEAEEVAFDAKLQKKLEILGFKANPGSAAAGGKSAPKDDNKDEPKTWAESVQGDKELASGLSFESEWKRGEVDLSNMPDNQDAYTLLSRAVEKYGEEPESDFSKPETAPELS